MTEEQRRQLVRDLQRLPTDADDQGFDPTRTLRAFLPLPQHAQALGDRVMVVRGERGSGKTALFHFLRAAKERGLSLPEVFADDRIPSANWIEGFSETSPAHAPPHVLRDLAMHRADHHLRAYWLGALAGVLTESLGRALPEPFSAAWREHRNDPAHWTDTARLSLGALSATLDALDRDLTAQNQRIYVTYDHLDRLFVDDPHRRVAFSSVLVDLWISLANRYRSLRPKIFLREDLYQAALQEVPDSSKVESRSVRLTWEPSAIVRLLARQIAATSDRLNLWLQHEAGVTVEHHPTLGDLPKPTFEDEADRKRFITALAGRQMGFGIKKGYSWNWLVKATADAHGRVLPRTVLDVVQRAAEIEVDRWRAAGTAQLLHHVDLTQALVTASDRRVKEIQEEHREVVRLEALRGRQLHLTRGELTAALGSRRADDGYVDDGDRVVDRLTELGVLSPQTDGRYDIPDIYRFHFGILRKGGPRRAERNARQARNPV